ncbi:PQQ-dependent sugar dehydrogenase [Cellulomonas palmilytica]|uniref:PQQ-dependent sugar dehydrogenase n=1 Tax=Cellulomonas palmilytica TaxID=2608402 RepID=UPI001F23DD09|nr:PQQ-dependent sugar dehydrogenase [Cellulomonas palmilytica]
MVGVVVGGALLAGCVEPAPTSGPTSLGSPVEGPTTSVPTDPEAGATTGPAVVQPSGPATVELDVATLATGLDVPWGIAPLEDGRSLVTLREEARLVLVDAGGTVTPVTGPGARQLADVVVPQGEGGLLGVAVVGASADGLDVALYTTTAQDNRVLRARLTGDTLGPLTAVLTGIPAARNHDGGRLAVGPDGFLYVSTGDAGDPRRAQDPDDLGGKILRLTPDGDAAPGNPVDGSPVWSLGHRNVQGLGWSSDGRMFASEFGQNTWDELNVIHRGANYGWPVVEGQGGAGDGFVDPVAVWPTSDASPSGLAVTEEAVYVAGLRGQRLWRVPLRPAAATDADGVGEPHALLERQHGRLRAAAVAADGTLLVVTGNTDGRGDPRPGDDRILRLTIR